MEHKKLSTISKMVLDEILVSDNPTDILCRKFEGASAVEEEIRNTIRELVEAGFITVSWANNRPYRVIVNNSAREYKNLISEYEKDNSIIQNSYFCDNSIKIGDGNTITGSMIIGAGSSNSINKPNKAATGKDKFVEKHPILVSLAVSLLTGFILLFSFWEKVINWIEEVL